MDIKTLTKLMDNAARQSVDYLNNARNALVAERTYYAWKEVTSINEKYHDLVILYFRDNIAVRDRQYKYANTMLGKAVEERNAVLAEIALTYIRQIQEMNPFLTEL